MVARGGGVGRWSYGIVWGVACLAAIGWSEGSAGVGGLGAPPLESVALVAEVREYPTNWQTFHSIPGKCSISLPHLPEHIKQIMPCPEIGYDLRYDVYIAAHEAKAYYMMLIAQYPPAMSQDQAERTLESFLNGLMAQGNNNELISAQLSEVQGHKALDFFIKSNESFFKGRAIMAHSNLYLLAMECKAFNYQEGHFAHFISSFMFMQE